MRNTLRFAVLTSKRHASACAIITSICSKEVAFSAHRSFATPWHKIPHLPTGVHPEVIHRDGRNAREQVAVLLANRMRARSVPRSESCGHSS